MPFTPVQAVAGGLSIGLSTFWNARINGKVTGVSGTLRNALIGQKPAFAFLTGLASAGMVLRRFFRATFKTDVIATIPMSRILPAGFLVGLGAAIGNGCTSGHAISGLSRLSKRSLVATVTFMAAGVITATLFNSVGLYDLDVPGLDFSNIFAKATPPAATEIPWILATVGFSALLPYIIARASQPADTTANSPTAKQELLNYALGFSFGSGLVVAGMAAPQKVVAFLDVVARTWDPTLVFVFVGALPIAFWGFRPIIQGKKPVLALESSLPSRTDVDTALVAGSCLFGAGWGLVGLCPGPAFVYLGAFPQSEKMISFGLAMAAGTALGKPVQRVVQRWST